MVNGVCPRCGFKDDTIVNTADTSKDTSTDASADASTSTDASADKVTDINAVNSGSTEPNQSSNPYAGQNQNLNPYAGQNQNSNPYAGQNQNSDPYVGQNQNSNPYAGQNQNTNMYGGTCSGNGMQPDDTNGNNSNSKLLVILITLIAAFIAVIVIAVVFNFQSGDAEGRGETESTEETSSDDSIVDSYEMTDSTQEPESSASADSEYYVFHDDIKNDLDYSVEKKHFSYDSGKENVKIEVDYQEVTDQELSDIDDINENFAYEVDYYKDYYEKKYAPKMADDGFYIVKTTCYVTYMDKDMLSVAFMQDLQCDLYNDYNIYSVNIDMKTGKILKNSDILNIDDSFAKNFRERCITQNGDDTIISKWDDNTLKKALESEDNLILLYTPVGMEVGVNCVQSNKSDYSDTGWTTVTYKDYEKYLK